MPNDVQASRLLTPADAASRLNICRRTLDNLHRDGRGPARTLIGARVLYLESEIERFIQQRTERMKNDAGDGNLGLAALIAGELLDREPCHSESTAPFVAAISDLLESIRDLDLAARAGSLNEDGAAVFVRAISVATKQMFCFSEAVRHGSLACDVHEAAVRTAAIKFPNILGVAGDSDE